MSATLRFIVDQSVSPLIAHQLSLAGFDAVHVRSLGMSAASDPSILALASQDQRVIVTQDTDFGTLLVASGKRLPSVILFRDRTGRPSWQAQALLECLPRIEASLIAGAVIVIDDASIRIRQLG